MKLRSALLAPVVLLAALALAACGPNPEHDHDQGADNGAGQSSGDPFDNSAALPPAEEETQAFFGDEAPVAIEALPEDDHDHGHDYGDGSEPHVH